MRKRTASRLGLSLEAFVFLDSLQKVETALRVADVFHAHVEDLLDDASVHAFLDGHSHRAGGDVPDGTSASLVQSVRQSSVLSTVGNNVNHVSSLVHREVL